MANENNKQQRQPNSRPRQRKRRRRNNNNGNRMNRPRVAARFTGTVQIPQTLGDATLRDDGGYFDSEPVPQQVPQYLSMRESGAFKVNAKACLVSSEFSKLQLDSEVDGKLLRLGWKGPSRITNTVGMRRSDERGLLVGLSSSTVRFHNQLDCRVQIRSNTPKARMPHPGNIAYRTPEQIHEVGPFETLVIEQKWANNNNDAPYEEMESGTDGRGTSTFQRVYPLMDFYCVLPDNVPQSQVAIKPESEAFKITVQVNFLTVRNPTTANPQDEEQQRFFKKQLQNIVIKDLVALRRVYEVDPAPISLESGDTMLLPVQILTPEGTHATKYIPQLANVTFKVNGQEVILDTYILSAYDPYNSTPSTGTTCDFYMTENGSILKYPVPITLWDSGSSDGESLRQFFMKIEAAPGSTVRVMMENANGTTGTDQEVPAVWCLMDDIIYTSNLNSTILDNVYRVSSSDEKGRKMTPTGFEYAVKGVRTSRASDNITRAGQVRFIGGVISAFLTAVRVLGVVNDSAQIIGRGISEIRSRIVGKRR